nr:hypothetical protein [Candidatus Cloacimonadota bacterium]
MCGIAGIYSFDKKNKIDLNLLKKMTTLIKHRGPYDEGYLIANDPDSKMLAYCGNDSTDAIKSKLPYCRDEIPAHVGFGFRRLPTVELSDWGHQPMYDPNLGIGIVFNGEIYNHYELRDELSSMGYRFGGHSDTEVIIKSYHAWGIDCVQRFLGMWAFSIWDTKTQTLFLSRDRFGIKPLYYAQDKDFFYWGSEIKEILAAPIPKTQNLAMIWRSMKVNAMMVYDDETYWQDIHSLKPGHNLIVRGSKIQIQKYFALEPEDFEQSTLSFEEASAEYYRLFLDSLKMQVRSDVEIAASLSGGLDSSAIVCQAAQLLDYPLRCFSTYYEDFPALDERPYIEIIAAKTGIRTNYIAPTASDAMAWWQEATYLNDLPIASGFVSQYALMKNVHESGLRILLSGQGSDEMSAGYRHAGYRYFADLLRGMKFVKFASEIRHYLSKNPAANLQYFGKTALSAFARESTVYNLEANRYRFEPFADDFVADAKSQAQGHLMQKIADIPASRLSNFLYNMMQNTSLGTLLHFEDRMSMAHSVESRVPFLDHRLVKLVFSLPSDYKIRPPYHKAIHRHALKDCVPMEIAQRKDKGIFGSPFQENWMRNELKAYIQSIIYSHEFRNRGIWNLPKIHERWHKYLKGSNTDAEMLYNVVSLELWYRSFA